MALVHCGGRRTWTHNDMYMPTQGCGATGTTILTMLRNYSLTAKLESAHACTQADRTSSQRSTSVAGQAYLVIISTGLILPSALFKSMTFCAFSLGPHDSPTLTWLNFPHPFRLAMATAAMLSAYTLHITGCPHSCGNCLKPIISAMSFAIATRSASVRLNVTH